MSQVDDSENPFQNTQQDVPQTRQPLRKPRSIPHQSSEERTNSPQMRSVIQKRCNRGSNSPSAGSLLATPIKREPARNPFVLSPDAAEFVPRIVASVAEVALPPITVKLSSVQDRLKKENLSDRYNSNTKRNSTEGSSIMETEPSNGVENKHVNAGVKSIVETLENFVINLTRDPGLYYKIEETFMSFLTPYFHDPPNNIMIISDTASMLFMHSVANPNFRYSGARLCITLAQYSPEFQTNLLLLCEKDINCRTDDIKGLLLFIAELYMNKIENSKMYGNMIVTGFDVLLSTQTEENVVASCQVLKLTGSKFATELPGNLEDILQRLEQLKFSMRNNIQSLIESVRKNCEVHFEESTNSDSQDLEQPMSIPGMEETYTTPILIGQDGIEVGLEDEMDSGDEDSDIEEMYAEYEKFLNLTK